MTGGRTLAKTCVDEEVRREKRKKIKRDCTRFRLTRNKCLRTKESRKECPQDTGRMKMKKNGGKEEKKKKKKKKKRNRKIKKKEGEKRGKK